MHVFKCHSCQHLQWIILHSVLIRRKKGKKEHATHQRVKERKKERRDKKKNLRKKGYNTLHEKERGGKKKGWYIKIDKEKWVR